MFDLESRDKPIGFFDSGVGGISVLRQAVKILPKENFIYLGDSKNAPYGTKKSEEIRKLTFDAAKYLIDKDVKAIVVACNTATSIAINDLRNNYKHIPFIGIEPALKPAVEMKRQGKIIIMATPMTLAEKKFSNLVINTGEKFEFEAVPCPGLVELIERGVIEGTEMESFLKYKLSDYIKQDLAAVVLGCTHYPFIKNALTNIIGEGVPIIDGSFGTAAQLKRQLIENNLISSRMNEGKIEIYNSSDVKELVNLSYRLLKM